MIMVTTEEEFNLKLSSIEDLLYADDGQITKDKIKLIFDDLPIEISAEENWYYLRYVLAHIQLRTNVDIDWGNRHQIKYYLAFDYKTSKKFIVKQTPNAIRHDRNLGCLYFTDRKVIVAIAECLNINLKKSTIL